MSDLPWTPRQIIQAVRGYSGMVAQVRGQQATIEAQTEEIARLKTRLSQADSIANDLQHYAFGLEQKFILLPPSGGSMLSEAEIVQYLPLPLTTRDNSQALVLSLSDWERFTIWAVTRVRAIRPYELDRWDCGEMTRMLLGLAAEWAAGLACGWVELTSPIQRDFHKMSWLLAQDTGGTMLLRYIDTVPRSIVPWPEGIFSDIGQWTIDRIGF